MIYLKVVFSFFRRGVSVNPRGIKPLVGNQQTGRFPVSESPERRRRDVSGGGEPVSDAPSR